jgi:hypothetical protein
VHDPTKATSIAFRESGSRSQPHEVERLVDAGSIRLRALDGLGSGSST